MNNPSNQDRVQSLYQMLFEMATGNFSFRANKSDGNDQLDELASVLNALALKMQSVILEIGFVTPHYSYQGIIQITFVLDNKFTINSLSHNVKEVLGYPPEILVNTNFAELLSDHSKQLWLSTIKEATKDKCYHNTVQFIFITSQKKIIPSFCTISRLLFTNKIFISTVTTVLQDSLTDTLGWKNPHPQPADSSIIQNVHDYILKHLDEPLPTVKELSKLFGTNEFKIKEGFRHFFSTSVYQFYNEERLKKAHLLIQQSSEPLKEIAFSCGFNDYTNFYKAFKKRFGYPPSDLQRNIEQD